MSDNLAFKPIAREIDPQNLVLEQRVQARTAELSRALAVVEAQ